jgi:hypothetical protein
MLGDYYTKPLQGGLFRKLGAVIMGHAHVDTLSSPVPTATQERVGSSVLRVVTQDSKMTHSRSGTDSQPSTTIQHDSSGGDDIKDTRVRCATSLYADVVKNGTSVKGESDSDIALTTLK